jgi:hypothetical protein
MLRLFMIVSGSFEALFGLSALVATAAVVGDSAMVWTTR